MAVISFLRTEISGDKLTQREESSGFPELCACFQGVSSHKAGDLEAGRSQRWVSEIQSLISLKISIKSKTFFFSDLPFTTTNP